MTNDAQMAEVLNTCFTHIAVAAGSTMEVDYGKCISKHPSIEAIIMNKANHGSFSFTKTSVKQVENLLMSVNVHKSVGHDLIPPKFMKRSAPVIASPLTAIMNRSIEHCSYPAR